MKKSNVRLKVKHLLVPVLLVFAFMPVRGADPDYLGLVTAYADAMVAQGRDTYGTVSSPLFAAVLNRSTMTLISTLPDIEGVRPSDRSPNGSNPQIDVGLYDILYQLADLTGTSSYAAEADKALKFFFDNTQSPVTGLMTWGEHLFWNLKTEKEGYVAGWGNDDHHEVSLEWPFWDQCYRLSPTNSWKFALGLWDHQVGDKSTGDFSRHARYSIHGPMLHHDFPRYAGQMIAAWADAYARSQNAGQSRRGEMLTAITLLTGRMESNRNSTGIKYLPSEYGSDKGWSTNNLEMARCMWKAAPLVPSALGSRMRTLAVNVDNDFLKLAHTITSGGKFVTTYLTSTGAANQADAAPYSLLWDTGYGYATHAGVANLCHARYLQVKSSDATVASKYRSLIMAAADQYLTSAPNTGDLLKPQMMSDVVELMLNAWDLTADKKYLDRADYFGAMGVQLFLSDGPALPRATNKHAHYETLTGGPSFMNSLLRLHLALKEAGNIPVTAVAAVSLSNTQVRVTYSEPVAKSSAETKGNYTFSGGAAVSTAALQADGQTVILTVSGLSTGSTYTLGIQNVTDASGSVSMTPAGITVKVTAPVQDNFQDKRMNWNPQTPSRWEIASDGGDMAYHLHTTDFAEVDGKPGEVNVVAGSALKTFELEVAIRSTEDAANGYADAGVVFGYEDADNYYYFLANRAMGYSEVKRVMGGNPAIDVCSVSESLLPGTAEHDCRILVADSALMIWWDGDLKVSQKVTIPAGQVGLCAVNDAGYYDDFTVYPIDGTINSQTTGLTVLGGAASMSLSRMPEGRIFNLLGSRCGAGSRNPGCYVAVSDDEKAVRKVMVIE